VTARGRSIAALLLALGAPAALAAGVVFHGPLLGPVPVEFVLFGAVLLGVALLHDYTLPIAVAGAVIIAAYRSAVSPFAGGPGLAGFASHLRGEWVLLVNLLLLLLGFALLARQFELSRIPAVLPRFLPDDWKGAFVLLVVVFVLSGFLDNIAAAMIGGTVAMSVFRRKVHVGYLAAIVAASNAGGAGSVVGDTTTTMLWISGIPPGEVIEAYAGAAVALLVFGVLASRQQDALQRIVPEPIGEVSIDWGRVGIVGLILALAVVVNVVVNTRYTALSDRLPFLGAAVWVAIGIGALWRTTDWTVLPGALRGALFLVALVLCASMMPVQQLSPPSWQATLGLGALSAVFDNIPLTALAIRQGGHDWGLLAYAVGFGGSMIWFGSSAGVALTGLFPEARSVGGWLAAGWHVAVGYLAGFFTMLVLFGFYPGATPHASNPAAHVAPVQFPAPPPWAAGAVR
jgi:Na+/H+ antiporter NhaD/arsenite permease-like protein